MGAYVVSREAAKVLADLKSRPRHVNPSADLEDDQREHPEALAKRREIAKKTLRSVEAPFLAALKRRQARFPEVAASYIALKLRIRLSRHRRTPAERWNGPGHSGVAWQFRLGGRCFSRSEAVITDEPLGIR
jgi:hypothetical protein